MRPDEMLPRVFLLKSGSIERDQAGNILDARSSVTLIKTERGWIIVDTGQVGDEEEILKALVDLGLEKSDIDIIVNTHSHPDHSPGAAPLQALVVQSGHVKPPIMGLPSAPTARAYSRFKPEVTLQDGERITLTSQGLEG